MRRRRLLLALLGAVALGACGKYGPPERTERRSPAPVAAQPAPTRVEAPAAPPEPEPEQEEQRR